MLLAGRAVAKKKRVTWFDHPAYLPTGLPNSLYLLFAKIGVGRSINLEPNAPAPWPSAGRSRQAYEFCQA